MYKIENERIWCVNKDLLQFGNNCIPKFCIHRKYGHLGSKTLYKIVLKKLLINNKFIYTDINLQHINFKTIYMPTGNN